MKFIFEVFLLLVLVSCQNVPKAQSETVTSNNPSKPKAVEFTPKAEQLEIVRALYELLFDGNDKKAKVFFARNYRKIPENVQFAVALRFEYWKHALGVLPDMDVSKAGRKFWERILASKPTKLVESLCQDFKSQSEFPGLLFQEPEKLEMGWLQQIQMLAEQRTADNRYPRDPWGINAKLSDLKCTEDVLENKLFKCEAVSAKMQSEIFTTEFFDKLRNGQRRDSAFYSAYSKDILKTFKYSRYSEIKELHRLASSIEATNFPRQNHFRRRLKGMGRDIRVDGTHGRYVGAVMWADQGDIPFATRLASFVNIFPLVDFTTRLDHGLASCLIPVVK